MIRTRSLLPPEMNNLIKLEKDAISWVGMRPTFWIQYAKVTEAMAKLFISKFTIATTNKVTVAKTKRAQENGLL